MITVNNYNSANFATYCLMHGLSPFVIISYITAIHEICERYNFNIKNHYKLLNLLDYECCHYLNPEIVELTYKLLTNCFIFDTIDDVLLGKINGINYDNANKYLYLVDIKQIINDIQFNQFLQYETIPQFFKTNENINKIVNKHFCRLILLKCSNAGLLENDPFRPYLSTINKNNLSITVFDEVQFRIYFLSMYFKVKNYPMLPSNLYINFSKQKPLLPVLKQQTIATYPLINNIQECITNIEEAVLNPNTTYETIISKISKLFNNNEQFNSILYGMLTNLKYIFEGWFKDNAFAKI